MSAFARQWDARVAPIDEPKLVWDDGKLVRESFAEHTLDGVRTGEVPVVAAHDESLRVGYIDQSTATMAGGVPRSGSTGLFREVR